MILFSFLCALFLAGIILYEARFSPANAVIFDYIIKKVYKKAIKTEQLLDEVISDEKTESEKDYIEKDSVFASIFEEIRELKKIRESREEEKNRELLWQRNLMSDISHQIKTPLASLEIYTDIFRKEMGDDNEKKELSDRAVEAIERIRWLVTGMLL